MLVQISIFASEIQDKQALALDKLVYLEQNWNDADREWFYFIDQGTRLIPYRIFINLEQADNNNLLSDTFNLLRFGFLPAKVSTNNPDGLPVGFTRNEGYIGLTCAACHTQQIRYQDKFIRTAQQCGPQHWNEEERGKATPDRIMTIVKDWETDIWNALLFEILVDTEMRTKRITFLAYLADDGKLTRIGYAVIKYGPIFG